MEIFEEEFISELPDDPMLAGYLILDHFLTIDEQYQGSQDFSVYLETYAFLRAIADENKLSWNFPEIDHLVNNQTESALREYFGVLYKKLREYYEKNEKERLVDKFSKKYRTLKRGAFIYEFSDGDLHNVQELITSLRERIANSDLFEKNHKRRLLNRLEFLQRELHKKQSDLDHFWGLVGDAGVAIGKFGKDAKPFVDLIREITNIVWRTQAKAEELPSDSPSPLLSSDEE